MNNTTAPTAPTKLTIAGPNLPAKAKATFEVHTAGCADLKRGYLRTADKMHVEVSTVRELVEYVYEDHMAENEPGSHYAEWTGYEGEFHLAPCCAHLPADEAQYPAIEAMKKVLADRKLTTEQKRRVGDAVMVALGAIIDTLPESIEDIPAELVAEQIRAWAKYIPTTK